MEQDDESIYASLRAYVRARARARPPRAFAVQECRRSLEAIRVPRARANGAILESPAASFRVSWKLFENGREFAEWFGNRGRWILLAATRRTQLHLDRVAGTIDRGINWHLRKSMLRISRFTGNIDYLKPSAAGSYEILNGARIETHRARPIHSFSRAYRIRGGTRLTCRPICQ